MSVATIIHYRIRQASEPETPIYVCLQAAFEWATSCKEPLYAVFVDHAKAYDCIDRWMFFEALEMEEGVPPSLVKALVYKGVS